MEVKCFFSFFSFVICLLNNTNCAAQERCCDDLLLLLDPSKIQFAGVATWLSFHCTTKWLLLFVSQKRHS